MTINEQGIRHELSNEERMQHMQQAGFTDYEIEEELQQRSKPLSQMGYRSSDELAENYQKMIERNTVRKENISGNVNVSEKEGMEDCSKKEIEKAIEYVKVDNGGFANKLNPDLRKDQIKMTDTNKERNDVYVVFPAKVGAEQESVRNFWVNSGKGEDGQQIKLAEITLPKGTEINGQDASYYKVVVRDYQVDPGGQKYPSTHSVRFPEANANGEDWGVKLQRDFGAFDNDKNWVPDVKEIECSSKELQVAMKEQYERYKEFRSEKQAEKSADTPSLTSEAKDSREASAELGNDQQSHPEPAR